jgi:CYTH domain-containing protein
MSAPGTEIERKFLVTTPPPELSRARSEPIKQGYVALTNDGLEVRVRSRGERAFLTIKKGAGRARLEEELEIDAERFARLWPLTNGRWLEKTRHVIRTSGGLALEVDVYAGELEGLATAEVEFASEADAAAFEPPSWFGLEVTEDPRYKNRWLACHGLPPEGRSSHPRSPGCA